ncbi:DUF1330 domain-containing protein [Actinomadura macrotermitis]|uniref:DUF1330 domain-containing protein n=1 Tax=Actinomadura macrotermitis TaxID=2585200 RepID=A0A7K0BTS4_9ACTN|nr:DUF1330 domain-containing protein [Actinomadura macrotermitis]MQY04585.1 hypothetical protein [Actinomadura macrotermitis]
MDTNLNAYAVGHLHEVAMGPQIVEYLERIDATLAPYGGRFLVHGARAEVREGNWAGDLIIIGFPDLARARAWYDSPEYQAIIPLRADNSRGDILIVDGCGADHAATDVLA